LAANGISMSWDNFLTAVSMAASVSQDIAQALFHLHYNGADSVPTNADWNRTSLDLDGRTVTDPQVIEPIRECRELLKWLQEIHSQIAEGRYESAIKSFERLKEALSAAQEHLKSRCMNLRS
jgi:hypothetical protein